MPSAISLILVSMTVSAIIWWRHRPDWARWIESNLKYILCIEIVELVNNDCTC